MGEFSSFDFFFDFTIGFKITKEQISVSEHIFKLVTNPNFKWE